MKKIFYLMFLISFIYIASCGHSHLYDDNWKYNNEYHYQEASCCQNVKKEEHKIIENVLREATHYEDGIVRYTCEICDYKKTVIVEYSGHIYSDEYYYDKTNHYFVCECGKKNDVEKHDYKVDEEILEESEYLDGIKISRCMCGSMKEEIINATLLEEDKNKDDIYLITTSVGTDISKSVGISWHSKESGSYLIYRKEGTTEFIKVIPNEEYWSIEESYVNDPYQNKRYVCSVDLNDLDENSKYYYKVISGNKTSNYLSFKTSDISSNKYSFLSFVDFQYSENQTTLKLVKKFIDNTPSANLITCSGDFTDEGYRESSHRHLFDSNVFSNSILAFGVGDHEYWGSGDSPIKMFERPYSYNKLFNNPDNGCSGFLNSSYYFKYNTTLFVFLDCGDSNVSSKNEMFSEQASWLDSVLTKENYEFIIVCMHKSLYGDPLQDSSVRKFAPIFTSVFDKHQVDLVISGHDHEYSRTKPIVNGEVSENGTIYLDLGNSGDKTRHTGEDIKTSNLYDKYIDIKTNNYSLGIIGTVENGTLSIVIRNLDYNIVDEVYIINKDRN